MFLFDKNLPLERKIRRSVTFVIRFTLLVALVGAIFRLNWTVAFMSGLALFLTFLPLIISRNYKIYLPVELEVTVVLFIYATLFLGEIHQYYTKFWWWDAVLHTGSGIALGFMGFLIIYILHAKQKVQAGPRIAAVFAFCFALSIGALWEIFEFSMDQLFKTSMQRSGLVDTMWDLIVDSGGALLASVPGYFYIKGTKPKLFERVVEKFKKNNPELFT